MRHAWSPPEHWKRITTIDAHTAGEPFRVVTSDLPMIVGDTMLEKRRWAKEHLDHLRRVLMWEPRGHADMYGCVVTDAVTPRTDFGVLFMHNEGWSTMCGHGVIAMAMIAVETGMVVSIPTATDDEIPESIEREDLPAEAAVTIDTPAGIVSAVVSSAPGGPTRVRFRNVASFADSLDQLVTVSGTEIRYDLAFGGAYYAFVDAESAGVSCHSSQTPRLIEIGMAIKRAVARSRSIEHPTDADLGFLYGVIFTGPAEGTGGHSRHVCVFAEGEVDRSPTGTGVSARLAILRARGEIEVGETIRIESIIGSIFEGRVSEDCRVGTFEAVIPEIEGEAFITGRHEFLLDPFDSIGQGFLVR